MLFGIQPLVNNVCPGFPRILQETRMQKTEQSIEKANKNNGHKVFLCISTGSVNFVLYPLSSINFTSSLFSKTSLFPPSLSPTEYAVPLKNHTTVSPPNRQTSPIQR